MSQKRAMKNVIKGDAKKQKVQSGHWSLELISLMEDPEYVIKSDNLVVAIRDGYAKAKYHYLILPKEDIDSLKDVNEKHLPLLKHMHKFAMNLVKELHRDSNFYIGYHAEPSMRRLHLHAISDDMNSPALKNKKHWNSYTTKFFLKSNDVLTSLEQNGKVTCLLSKEECMELINTPLKCHKCSFVPKNLPDLKMHILVHIK